jgi:hypothetical protein
MELNDKPKLKPSIYDKFKVQQDEIFYKLFNILNINKDDPQSFIISKKFVDSKKEEIETLYSDIMTYFSTSVNRTIKVNTDNKYMSIFRQLFKHNGYVISSKSVSKTIDGKQEKTMYYVLKPNVQIK